MSITSWFLLILIFFLGIPSVAAVGDDGAAAAIASGTVAGLVAAMGGTAAMLDARARGVPGLHG